MQAKLMTRCAGADTPRRMLLVLVALQVAGMNRDSLYVNAIQCSVCDYARDGMSCVRHPPAPTACWYDDCIIVKKENSRGDLLAFTRSCSPMAIEVPVCMKGLDVKLNEKVKLCYWTCSDDGCNAIRSFHYTLDFTKRRVQLNQRRRRSVLAQRRLSGRTEHRGSTAIDARSSVATISPDGGH